MKILYLTDLHGNPDKYGMLISVAKQAGAKIIINGGDMLPTHEDLHLNQKHFLNGFLDKHFADLQKAGIIFMGYFGNDDLRIFDDRFNRLIEKYKGIYNLAQRKVLVRGYEFIGMNWVVDYPFRLKDRCRMDYQKSEIPSCNGDALISRKTGWHRMYDWPKYVRQLPSVAEELKRLPEPIHKDKAIYVFHMPPSRIGLDVCHHGGRVGSDSIFNFIRERQPLVTLHGHIHESPEMSGVWKNNIGRAICVQPGQRSYLTFVLIDLPNLQFERVILELPNKRYFVPE